MEFKIIEKNDINFEKNGLSILKYAILEQDENLYLQIKLQSNLNDIIEGFSIKFMMESKVYHYHFKGCFEPNKTYLEKTLIPIKNKDIVFLDLCNFDELTNQSENYISYIKLQKITFKSLELKDEDYKLINDLMKKRELVSVYKQKMLDLEKSNEEINHLNQIINVKEAELQKAFDTEPDPIIVEKKITKDVHRINPKYNILPYISLGILIVLLILSIVFILH